MLDSHSGGCQEDLEVRSLGAKSIEMYVPYLVDNHIETEHLVAAISRLATQTVR